jgi:hypothetical protein
MRTRLSFTNAAQVSLELRIGQKLAYVFLTGYVAVLDAMTRSEGFFPEEIVQLMSFMVQSANFLESLSETESSLY